MHDDRELGLSTRAVAARISRRIPVSHTTIAAYENGVTMPPIDILAALADLYGRTLNWLLDDRNTFSGVRLRNVTSRVGINDRRQFDMVAAKWSDAYRQLERHLDLSLRANLRVDVRSETDPKLLAAQLRKHLGLDDVRPIANMVEVLEDTCAIRVLELRSVDSGRRPCRQAWRRKRGSPEPQHQRRTPTSQHCNRACPCSLWNNGVNRTGHREEGLRVRIILAPARFSVGASSSNRQIVSSTFIAIKEKYGISVAAMIHRAEELRLIKTTTSRWLWTEMIRRGWKALEPGHVWRDRAIRFETMLESSIHTRSLTWADAEAVTGVRENELKQRLDDVTAVNEPLETEGEEQRVLKFPDLEVGLTFTADWSTKIRRRFPSKFRLPLLSSLGRILMSGKKKATRRPCIKLTPPEKRMLEELYVRRRVPTDQFKERPDDLAALVEEMNCKLTGRVEPIDEARDI